MPVIFSTSLLAVPGAVVKFSGVESLQGFAAALSPGGSLYLPTNVVLIVAINYYYTFLQLDPNDVSDQLKRGVRCVPCPPYAALSGCCCTLLSVFVDSRITVFPGKVQHPKYVQEDMYEAQFQ